MFVYTILVCILFDATAFCLCISSLCLNLAKPASYSALLLLSAKVDGTLLIVRQGFAEKEGVRQAVDLLKHVNAHIIGVVLNDVDASTDGYYGYYGYGKEK